MADNTAIEWTDATWNPTRGCTRVSPGCGGANHQGGCYAEKIAARFSGPGQPFAGYAERTEHGGRWTGKLGLVPGMLTLPLRWKKPRRIFVNSMSDLFHEALPDEVIDQVFAVMALASQHTYQVLTKRSHRMRAYLTAPNRENKINGAIWSMLGTPRGSKIEHGGEWRAKLPLPGVWLGVSVEDQDRADERIPDLLATPAAVRFLSGEPLLGPLDITAIRRTRAEGFMRPLDGRFNRLHWVIAGGESGPNSRPMHPDWARSLRDQCQAAGVPFFFKQWGEYAPCEMAKNGKHIFSVVASNGEHLTGARAVTGQPGDDRAEVIARVGKKAAGARLDGREWREFPT